MNFVSNTNYNGSGQVITSAVSLTNLSNVTIKNYTFSGIQVQMNGCHNVVIQNCTFIGGASIEAPTSIYDCSIVGNTFGNNTVSNATGITLYVPFRVHVDGNVFTNIAECCHMFFGYQTTANDCTYNFNTMTHISRHGAEFQQAAQGLEVSYNWYSDPTPNPDPTNHNLSGHMCLSVATGASITGTIVDSHNVNVHHNILDMTGVDSASKVNTAGIEIMGNNPQVHDNYIVGTHNGILYCMIDETDTSSRLTLINNLYINCDYAYEAEGSGSGKSSAIPVSVNCQSFTTATAPAKPSMPAFTFTTSAPIQAVLNNSSSSSIGAQVTSTASTSFTITAKANGNNYIDVTANPPAGTAKITYVVASSSVGEPVLSQSVDVGSANTTIGPVRQGWGLIVHAAALSASFAPLGTSNAIQLTMPGNGSAAYPPAPNASTTTTTTNELPASVSVAVACPDGSKYTGTITKGD